MIRFALSFGRMLAAAALLGMAGCSTLASNAAGRLAGDLSTAILNQDDPETVRDGAPAYLLLIDSFAQKESASGAMLESAAELYSAYAAVFVDDPQRAKRLSKRARNYGERAFCRRRSPAGAGQAMAGCGWSSLEFATLEAELAAVSRGDAPALYAFTVSWLVWIRAHSDEWTALADLPKVEAALDRLQTVDSDFKAGSVQLYLGVLHTLRPPALGGDPDAGRNHFEQAVALSGGRDLGAKVEFARSYARMVYDRELHDRLLSEVLEADPRQDGYTLLNVLAQREAEALLASADEYF